MILAHINCINQQIRLYVNFISTLAIKRYCIIGVLLSLNYGKQKLVWFCHLVVLSALYFFANGYLFYFYIFCC